VSPEGGINNTLTAPKLVTPYMVGLVSQDYPFRGVTSGGNGSSAPPFGFGIISTFDCSARHWRSLQSASRTANLAPLVADVATLRSLGCSGMFFPIYGTPTFNAQPAHQSITGPYGGLGEGSPPTDLALLQNSELAWFVTQLATLNITPVAQGGLGGFIKGFCVGNEYEANNFSGTTVGSWWGTAAQAVDMAAIARTAWRAVDPTIIQTTYGMYDFGSFDTWLATYGTYTGKRGAECFDKGNLHTYWATPNRTYSGRGDFWTLKQGGVYGMRKSLAPYGLQEIGIWIGEHGFDSGGTKASPSATIQAFEALPADQRTKYLRRTIKGAIRIPQVEALMLFSYGGTELCGDLAGDPAVQAACAAEWAHVGKTLVLAYPREDGTEVQYFSNGSTDSI